MTVDRSMFGSKNYIYQTIDSLEKNSTEKLFIKLVVGSPETEYLEKYKIKYTVIPFPTNKWNFIKLNSVRYRAIFNYYRCLGLYSSDALIFEDDINFTDNWLVKLNNIVKDIENQGIRKYILSLYSPYQETSLFEKDYGFLGSFLFYGTQGMYYPSTIKKDLYEYIYQEGVLKNSAPYDELVAQYAAKNKIPIIDCKKSLVQHIAPDDSTGLCIKPHTSPTF